MRFIVIILLLLYPASLITAAKKKPFGPFNTKLVKVEKKKKAGSEYVPSTSAWFFTRFIRAFQVMISPLDGPNCRYTPTCSGYAYRAINKYGPVPGIIMSADRYMRCNPFGAWGYDPPEQNYFCNHEKKKN